jgi:cysteinyl-tRNA synthetase
VKLFNTLTKKIEEFESINPSEVGMYTCGPTPYDYQHIGNFRTMIFSDILRRTLEANGYKVKAVRNITDIDDKIIKKAKEKSSSLEVVTGEYIQIFFNDLNKLNIMPADISPKATEHVGKMVKYIEGLIEKGFAYIQEGSVYFDISKFPDYGKLSQLDKRDLKTGTRMLSDEYEKDNIQDFALWKAVDPAEVGYDSPWGKGRPGWHIECSVMSQEYLGETFDIHTGGIDLLFPHHENEIAQSEASTGKPFVKFFVHAEMMMVDGAKMAKSLKNFYTIKDLEERGIDPLAFRYLVLTAHYRDKLNFTWESLESAQTALNRIREEIRGWEVPIGESEQSNQVDTQIWQRFIEAANNDLGMPQAVALLHELIHKHTTISSNSATILQMDQILGLGLDQYLGKPLDIPSEVVDLVEKRETVRKAGDFKKSDEIRKEIKDLGYEILDTPEGPKIRR